MIQTDLSLHQVASDGQKMGMMMRKPIVLTTLLFALGCVHAALYAQSIHTADINGDHRVDDEDRAMMKSLFFQNAPQADLNADGVVDFADLAQLQRAMHPGTPLSELPADASRLISTVSLPGDIVVSPGETFTITIVFDGIGNPILGGGFVLDYDPAQLRYVPDSFEYVLVDIAGQPCDLPTSQCIVLEPIVVDDVNGMIEAAAGDFTGIGLLGQPVEVATVAFEVVGQGPDTVIDIAEGGLGGVFVCLFDPACTGLTFVGSAIQIATDARPIIEVTPPQVTFAPTADTQTTAVDISNSGDADLTLGTIAGLDPLAAPFAISADACSGQVLSPGSSCNLKVQFDATQDGLFSDSFDVPSDDPFSPSVLVPVDGEKFTLGIFLPGSGFNFALCVNNSTGERIPALAVGNMVDCVASGLTVSTGDTVSIFAVAVVELIANVFAIPGGLDPTGLLAICTNLTTGQNGSYFPGTDTITCASAGVAVSTGDRVIITARGAVQ